MLTKKHLQSLCREAKLPQSGTKEDLMHRLIDYVNHLPPAELPHLTQGDWKSILCHAYREMTLEQIVDLVGTGEVDVAIHNGYCTDGIKFIKKGTTDEYGNTVLGGVWMGGYVVRTWFQSKIMRRHLSHVYHVSCRWLANKWIEQQEATQL